MEAVSHSCRENTIGQSCSDHEADPRTLQAATGRICVPVLLVDTCDCKHSPPGWLLACQSSAVGCHMRHMTDEQFLPSPLTVLHRALCQHRSSKTLLTPALKWNKRALVIQRLKKEYGLSQVGKKKDQGSIKSSGHLYRNCLRKNTQITPASEWPPGLLKKVWANVTRRQIPSSANLAISTALIKAVMARQGLEWPKRASLLLWGRVRHIPTWWHFS